MTLNLESLSPDIKSETFSNEVLPNILERAQRLSENATANEATSQAAEDLAVFEIGINELARSIFSGNRHEYSVALKAHLQDIETLPITETVAMVKNEAMSVFNWFKKSVSGKSKEISIHNEQELGIKLAKRQEAISNLMDSVKGDPMLAFQALFDETPVGNIEIRKNPISLEIYVEKEEDFTRISEIDNKTGTRIPIPAHAAAMNIKGTRDEALVGAIIVISNERAAALPQTMESLLDHEKQHAFRIFIEQKRIAEIRNIYDVVDELGVYNLIGQVPEAERSLFARDYLRFLANLSLEIGVKDEMLAYYRCGVPVEYTKAMLRADSNYYGFDRNEVSKLLVQQGIEKTEAVFITNAVLLDEYNAKVNKAVTVVDNIRIKNGWTRQETATRLTDKNIDEWVEMLETL